MTAYIAVALAALIAAGLTLYSGFGLGTLLLPVFALFFPAEMAVVATAMVHGANNVFKVSLLGRYADREVVLKFGLPAIAAAVLGALALGWFAQSDSSLVIEVNEEAFSEITPVKLMIGLLMIGFALFELMPRFRDLRSPGCIEVSISGQGRIDHRTLCCQQCCDRLPGRPDPYFCLCSAIYRCRWSCE